MNELEEANGRWGYAFLIANGLLPEEARVQLIKSAIAMYYKEDESKRLVTDWYEGRISTKKEYCMLGTFAGQRFDAELDTDKGKINVAFLVQDMTKVPDPTDLSARMN